MKAVAFDTPGGPEVLNVVDLPDPEVGQGEVLIRVQTAAVSPTDTMRRAGARTEGKEGPFVPGMDVAGIIEAIDADANTDLTVGEKVMAIVVPDGAHGAYAQRVVVPIDSVVRMPEGATFAEACTLPMNGLTARLALDTLDLPEGSTLVVTGAAGVLGGYVIQLAKADGLVVMADTSDADDELVLSLGADIVKLRGETFPDAVRTEFPKGVDAVVDAAVLEDDILPAVKDGGTVITIRGAKGERDRGVTFQPIWVANYAKERAKLDALRQQVEDGVLTLRVADVLQMEDAAEAHRKMEAGGIRGRIVLEFGDIPWA
ncbi:MAG TPA: NADP-dependent oxidoreductase [Enteractinococcus helveticum]|uniref:NADP-dependent oxidoreductase n=1 Tax=Enteractinococcus helveticum TaxID=1837282 RepID=A0A921K6Y7_9MICC|nr:NADP-dependent oxidoreductase [Enteractinococcus helveticum]HJF13957.1 NADP-dependent oxidoreductase [Enteractinococcus helveticum]